MLKLLAALWLLILLFIGGLGLLVGFGFWGVNSTVSGDTFSSVELPTPVPVDPTIDQVLANDGRFTSILVALDAADLSTMLSLPGSYTVFAPTDDAIAALPDGTMAALLEDVPTLTDILLYHVVAGRLSITDIAASSEISMFNGDTVIIRVEDDGRIFINQAEIIVTDLYASNGVVHAIDAVLIPSEE